MDSRSFKAFRLSLLATAGALSLASMGGCPQAQTGGGNSNDNTNSNTNTNSSTDNNGSSQLPRPVIPVDTTTSTGGTTTPTSPDAVVTQPTGGGNNTGNQSGTVSVTLNSPTAPILVRNNSQFSVSFDLRDSSGALSKAEIVVARDDNGDGQPDAAPVLARTISATAGANSVTFNTSELASLLNNGFGKFVIGVRTTTIASTVAFKYASAAPITVDTTAPTATWVAPTGDNLKNKSDTLQIQFNTSDNSPHTVRVLADPDTDPANSNEQVLVPDTQFAAGAGLRTFNPSLAALPSGSYNLYIQVSDSVGLGTNEYPVNSSTNGPIRIGVTNRLIGTINVAGLDNATQNNGGVLQGFNFNDLAGSSISRVPDVNADGRDELIIGSRYGKPYLIQNDGVGFGEAYMVYGNQNRIIGKKKLNQVGVPGGNNLQGLIFTGLRTPRAATNPPPPAGLPVNQQLTWSTRWTTGLSDITVIPDMDGDGKPEIVFSFPRAESINIGEQDPSIQHPLLTPDLPSMGDLEYNAFYGMPPMWNPNEAQFTRGGIVIVSSHNELLQNPTLLNRKSGRIIDLHEVGQLFDQMQRPGIVPYIRNSFALGDVCVDCDGQPPMGWTPGMLDMTGMGMDTPGTCGTDGCDRAAGGDGFIDDGREKKMPQYLNQWDVAFTNQGPGGFHNDLTVPPAIPPLVNYTPFPYNPMVFPLAAYIPTGNAWPSNIACNLTCHVTNEWFSWVPGLPGTSVMGTSSWTEGGNPPQTPQTCFNDNPPGPFDVPPDPACNPTNPPCMEPPIDTAAGGVSAWSGFYGPQSVARIFSNGNSYPAPIGARVLGQKVDDNFGASVSSDGTWLYVAAPQRTANDAPYTTDVPSLAGSRSKSGVVYQLRTNAPTPGGGPTRTQLWLEYGTFPFDDDNNPQTPPVNVQLGWPFPDAEDIGSGRGFRTDYTMPVPHTYLIKSVGSTRGDFGQGNFNGTFGNTQNGGAQCPPAWESGAADLNPNQAGTQISDASAVGGYFPYPTGTAGFYMGRTPEIVGPHADAKMSFVRAIGDLNDDGVQDFAVGSPDVKKTSVAGTNVQFNGPTVGSIFIVYGRPPNLEGDYLLEQLALDVSDSDRLGGVLLQGANAGEKLARVIDGARDFNGDGIDDVIFGNEGANSNAGEAVVLLGSQSLVSPAGGWTPAQVVAEGRAIRFFSSTAGDLVGANVSSAGDVDGDGLGDILISSPGAVGGKGAVYLIYGSRTLTGSIDLAKIGTVDLPGAKFVGRNIGDQIGSGGKTVMNTDPAGNASTSFSRGLAPLGDIDGDGRGDFAISSMLADPDGRTDAGEVYVLYGRGN